MQPVHGVWLDNWVFNNRDSYAYKDEVIKNAKLSKNSPYDIKEPLRGVVMNTKLKELPVDERIKLVEELWDSIASDQQALRLTPEQKAELDLRLDAYEVDKNTGRLASAAIEAIRRKL